MTEPNGADLPSFSGRPITVVDVGARWGVGEQWASLAPDVQVFGFDPDPEECARLNELAAADPGNYTTYVPVALGPREETVALHVTQQPACSSIYPPIAELIETVPVLVDITPVQDVDVALRPLDTWCAENGIEYIDALKIDTQGSELGVLQGAEHILSTVQFLEIEVEFNPIYAGQPLFGDVDAFLRARGFALWRLDNLVHYGDGGLIDGMSSELTLQFGPHRNPVPAGGGQLYWGHAYYARTELCFSSTSVPDAAQAARAAAVAAAAGFRDLAVSAEPNGPIAQAVLREREAADALAAVADAPVEVASVPVGVAAAPADVPAAAESSALGKVLHRVRSHISSSAE